MSTGAIVMAWNRAVPGREEASNALFGRALEYLGGQVNKGTIKSFEPVLIGAHAGNVNGLFLIKGAPDKLGAMTATDEWLDLITSANYDLEGFGVFTAYVGDDLQKLMGMWQKKIR